MSHNYVQAFFKEHGHMTTRRSKINRVYGHIIKDILHVGITKSHIFLIVPHRHVTHKSKCEIYDESETQNIRNIL